ncbi:MAG: hypothetical protein ISR49_21845 [Alphaproteobacteria bacterium]|nr:hypothetical protein [Alphaproteobacteria bacterium]
MDETWHQLRHQRGEQCIVGDAGPVATRDHGAHLFQCFRKAWRKFGAGGVIDGFEQTLR